MRFIFLGIKLSICSKLERDTIGRTKLFQYLSSIYSHILRHIASECFLFRRANTRKAGNSKSSNTNANDTASLRRLCVVCVEKRLPSHETS